MALLSTSVKNNVKYVFLHHFYVPLFPKHKTHINSRENKTKMCYWKKILCNFLELQLVFELTISTTKKTNYTSESMIKPYEKKWIKIKTPNLT